MKQFNDHIDQTKLPPEELENYWCESCCNYDRERESHDGCAFCKLTGMQTYGQMFGGGCKGFNVPADFLEDVRIKESAPCDIELIIKEDYPFGMSLKEDCYIGSSMGLKFTYCKGQYGTVRYLPTPKVSADDLRAALPNMLRDIFYFLFKGEETKDGKI